MHINKKIIVVIVFICTAIVIGASPGTSEDPLVSQSYVDDKINQVLMLVAPGSGTGVSSDLKDEIVEEVLLKMQGVSLQGAATGGSYQTISITAGQRVICGEGGEIIMRSGYAKVYSTTQNGIVNVTKGIDMTDGRNIDLNNLLVIPREGRGITATSDCWLMIKGAYTIYE